ncbi:MAG: hypothetical protein II479_08060 [Bacteroidales bacterium]|jgi:hypothetical protein|nr:hypothetical protein [Bacteroidales bacterium]
MTGGQFKQVLLEGVKALFKGEFLLRIGADKYFIHIIYAFFLALVVIWLSLRIDTTLMAVEKNKAVLNDLSIQYAAKTGELVKMNRISTVQEQLRKLGSPLEIPQQPPVTVKKK